MIVYCYIIGNRGHIKIQTILDPGPTKSSEVAARARLGE